MLIPEQLEYPDEELPDVQIEQKFLIAVDLYDLLLASMLAAEALLLYDVLASTVTVSFILHDAIAVACVVALLEAVFAEQRFAVDLAIEASVAYMGLVVLSIRGFSNLWQVGDAEILG